MADIIVEKSEGLSGRVRISGSKNSSLPILASCILTKGKNVLSNIPNLSDVGIMYNLLESLGAVIDKHSDEVIIDCEDIKNYTTPYDLVAKMRGSFLLSGPLLARMGRARISLPGGCPIGTRPVDLHLKGFSAMGAEIEKGHGYVDMSAKKLRGAKIYLDFPSVGATENIIMAAVLAEGETIIENAAAEPEIADLADFLNKQGAKIQGAGSDTVKIQGVGELTPCVHRVIPDRIEAGTFMTAFAITKGSGIIENADFAHLMPVSAKLEEMGVKIKDEGGGIIRVDARGELKTSDIKTLPFPGFPTDMQAPFTVLLSLVEGTGIIVETVFENRFLHIAELNRMGASIRIDGRASVIEGAKKLTGTQVNALDLRGGAALVLAGMTAKGNTEIDGVNHIKRGYDNFFGKLIGLGAKIHTNG